MYGISESVCTSVALVPKGAVPLPPMCVRLLSLLVLLLSLLEVRSDDMPGPVHHPAAALKLWRAIFKSAVGGCNISSIWGVTVLYPTSSYSAFKVCKETACIQPAHRCAFLCFPIAFLAPASFQAFVFGNVPFRHSVCRLKHKDCAL